MTDDLRTLLQSLKNAVSAIEAEIEEQGFTNEFLVAYFQASPKVRRLIKKHMAENP